MVAEEPFLVSSSLYHWMTTMMVAGDGMAGHPRTVMEIPIESPESGSSIPVAVAFTHSPARQESAAVEIQAAYRGHLVQVLVRIVRQVKQEADRLEAVLQAQETVDRVRTDPRERLRLNEELMRLLLRLDSVPGLVPSVRDLRRRVSRKIVDLQEILDAVASTRLVGRLRWMCPTSWHDPEDEEEEGERRVRALAHDVDDDDEGLLRLWGLQSVLQF
ncbi:BAG family molecular chaperone regulator 5, mitochondrial-like [Nymphaea colorata]|uniref:BAG domain-containing protein n=1 Tax=Nymphaea colorata TaxID=210225 RepID=A0A5K0WFQ0_9MAGN|nr:BAG family molecular chaperone regulator 5, mitochondrial-like [Nymphaea colorata]